MRRNRITRRRALVGLLVAGALAQLVLAIAVVAKDGSDTPTASTALPLHPVAGTFKPDATSLTDCSDDVPRTCVEQAFGNIAFYEGPKVALTRFDERFGEGENPDCHRVAHTIGSASLARNEGNVARTFAQGSSSCFSGYYHGVLERSLVGARGYDPQSLGRVARVLCNDVQRTETRWLAYQCLHGLGHGLMITTGYTLPLSLDVCGRLETGWQRTSCNGGAFMENISTSYGVTSRWLRDDDPVYPCNSVAEEDKVKCYEIVTSRILRTVDRSWERTSEICAATEKRWVTACFRSLGRDSAGEARMDVPEILRLCGLTRPDGGEPSCIYGAAAAMTGNFKSGRQASVLCTSSAPEHRARCFAGLGSVMYLFGSTESEQEANCRTVAGHRRYVTACMQGGREYLHLTGKG